MPRCEGCSAQGGRRIGADLRRAFGTALPGDLDYPELRTRLARHLLTVEFLASLTGAVPPELATISRPSDPRALEACIALVRTWRLRRDLQSSYVSHTGRVERELGLHQISFTLEKLRSCETFALTEQILQAAVELALTNQPAEELPELARMRIAAFWAEQRPAIQPAGC